MNKMEATGKVDSISNKCTVRPLKSGLHLVNGET